MRAGYTLAQSADIFVDDEDEPSVSQNVPEKLVGDQSI